MVYIKKLPGIYLAMFTIINNNIRALLPVTIWSPVIVSRFLPWGVLQILNGCCDVYSLWPLFSVVTAVYLLHSKVVPPGSLKYLIAALNYVLPCERPSWLTRTTHHHHLSYFCNQAWTPFFLRVHAPAAPSLMNKNKTPAVASYFFRVRSLQHLL